MDLLEQYKSLGQGERAEFMASLSPLDRAKLLEQMRIANGDPLPERKRPLPPMQDQPFKETKAGQLIFFIGGLILIGFVCLFSYKCNDAEYSRTRSPSSSRQSYIWSGWDGSNRQLVAQIKASLKDPSSFKLIGTGEKREGQYLYVTMKYTATNSFGGRITGTALAKCDRDGNVIEILQYE